ncbi:MAG: TIGR02099 family protein [Hahellaceae bacterium]|nr:TIGR02099 family protein [Hahellaceae bacterium]
MLPGAGVFRRLTRWVVRLLVLFILVLAAYQGAGRLLVGQIHHFSEDLATLISEQAGLTVSIVDLQGGWQQFDPVFGLAGVTIEIPRNPATPELGSHALVLDSLTLIPNVFGSLWARKLIVRELRVGSLVVDLGILSQLSETEGVETPQLPVESPGWLAELGRLAIPKMAFDDILIRLPEPHVKDTFWKLSDLTIRKDGYHFVGSGSLRNQRGDIELATARMDVWLEGGIERMGGTVYLQWDSGNFLLPVNSFIERDELRIDDLESSGQLWLKLKKGQLRQVTAEARLDNLKWRKALDTQKPLDHLDFRIEARRQAESDQWRALMDQFSLKWGDSGISNAKVRVDIAGRQTDVSWDRLDVGLLVNLFQVVGLGPKGLQDALEAYRPAGFVDGGLLTLSEDEPFQLTANLADFRVDAVDGAPAGQNIQGWIQVNSRMGEVIFAGRDPFLHFPQLYSDGWRFEYGQGRVYWNLYDNATEVIGENIQFSNPDQKKADLTGEFSLWIPDEPGTPNDFGLSLGVLNTDAVLAPSFVPDKLSSPAFAQWMTDSIRGGEITLGGYQFAGLIGKAAPPDSSVSQMFFEVNQGVLRFHPEWPVLEQFSGRIAMRNGEMTTTIDQGTLGATTLTAPAKLSLSTGDGDSVLVIETAQTIKQADFEYWLRHTPISSVVGDAFDGWSISGKTEVSLRAALPLSGNRPVTTDLSIFLNQAGLEIASPALQCENLTGRFGYRSVAGVKGSANGQCLGESVSIGLDTLSWQAGNEKLRLQVESGLGLSFIQKQTGITQLDAVLEGETRGHLEMGIPLGEGEHTLRLETSLEGMAIGLPAPLGKPAEQKAPLVFSGTWQADPGSSDWTLDWPGRLQMKFQMQNGVFRRGLLGLGGMRSAEYAQDGLWVEGRLNELNVSQWASLAQEIKAKSSVADTGPATSGEAERIQLPPWFAGAVVQVDRLVLSDYSFPATRVGVMPHENQVQVLLANDAGLEGEIVLPTDPLQLPSAQFERLYLPESVASREGGMSPADVPRARVDIKDLRLGKKTLGHWSWTAESRSNGVIFNNLDGRVKGGRIKGRISWLEDPDSGQQTTILTGGINGKAFHTFYEQWNEGKAPLTSKAFNVDVGVVWSGGPADFAWENLNGHLGFSMSEGTFRETSRSADFFRIFGILNTDAIVRRLKLDFTDLYEQGLAYDQLEGRARIQEGTVSFDSPLAIQAPSSGFKLTGKTSLVDDSLDMKLVVVLPLTQNLPLAALLVGAPTVGGALFLIDKLLGDSLSQLTSATYRITGTLQAPEVALEGLLQ